MSYKKLIPCIYLEHKMAVTGVGEHIPVTMNPLELAQTYFENNADALLISDLSETDLEHEEHILLIKQIAAAVEIPIIALGHIQRVEDVKKFLYAGCQSVVLDLGNPKQAEILAEVSARFGKDKIIGAVWDAEMFLTNKDLLKTHCVEMMILQASSLKKILEINGVLPVIANLPEVSLDKMFEFLDLPYVSGITGDLITKNAKEINSLKSLCVEKGISVQSYEIVTKWSDLEKNANDMIPVVVQDYRSDEVLMVAYMNEEAYAQTLRTKRMTYYSRSRQELWLKGETSGHYQYLKALYMDCDKDTLLAKVSQVGAACHTGNKSCFFQEIWKEDMERTNPLTVLESVLAVIKDRKVNPKEGSYTNYLFDKGIDKILKKLGEEATEIVIASKNPNPEEIKYEISDFLYHMMVLMVEKGVNWEEIMEELANR